jgi:hypothetical protein
MKVRFYWSGEFGGVEYSGCEKDIEWDYPVLPAEGAFINIDHFWPELPGAEGLSWQIHYLNWTKVDGEIVVEMALANEFDEIRSYESEVKRWERFAK